MDLTCTLRVRLTTAMEIIDTPECLGAPVVRILKPGKYFHTQQTTGPRERATLRQQVAVARQASSTQTRHTNTELQRRSLPISSVFILWKARLCAAAVVLLAMSVWPVSDAFSLCGGRRAIPAAKTRCSGSIGTAAGRRARTVLSIGKLRCQHDSYAWRRRCDCYGSLH